ncbi:uncharacterized protein RAG0_07409 [Rhynchosporium agropyri]|uniref:Heterokaryon incompatibility domain-containing protein n=1 Tax=Rhynchosporium agropyri TaxID=914238 RepID=A0A1E1KLD9_9HELO|nr:uncharacterized protein RAG0_07409 [Rhynchosporium agropyri]
MTEKPIICDPRSHVLLRLSKIGKEKGAKVSLEKGYTIALPRFEAAASFQTRFSWQRQRTREAKGRQQFAFTSPLVKAPAQLSSFQYSPINNLGTIRLIRLRPSQDFEAGIRCRLIKTKLKKCSLDLAAHFVALSCVWGDKAERKKLRIGLYALEITASLEYALRHIRDQNRVSYVWADGVCIDQDSIEDRNLQVSQMGVVYSTARSTIIFLGPSSPESDLVTKIISRGKGPPHILNPANGEDTVATSDTFAYSNMFEEHIMGATWFTRVWVLQELILSVNPLVQFGTRRMSWADFYTHAQNHRRTSRPELDSFNQIEIIKTKYYADSTNADLRASAIWLLDILDRRRGAGVSDPRDMIYAHLSLCNIALRNYVPVDYSISYEDL